MRNRLSTVGIPIDPVRKNNPIEKWRKRLGLTAPETARRLGYDSVQGYHKLVRCQTMPLKRLARWADLSGEPLEDAVRYFRRHGRNGRAA